MSTYVRYYPEIKVNGKWYWAVMHNPLSFVKDRNLIENKKQINITDTDNCLLTDECGYIFKQFVEGYSIEKLFNDYYSDYYPDDIRFAERGIPGDIDPKLLTYINNLPNGSFNHTCITIKELNELIEKYSKDLYNTCLKDSKDSQYTALNDKIDLLFKLIKSKQFGTNFDNITSFDTKLKKIFAKNDKYDIFAENFEDKLNYIKQFAYLINILDFIGYLVETVYKVEDKRYIITFE